MNISWSLLLSIFIKWVIPIINVFFKRYGNMPGGKSFITSRMNDGALEILICILFPPAFFVCVKNYYIFDSHNKRTSDNIWSVIIIHDLGGRKPSFSLHVHRPSKACTLNDQTFQSYLGNNLMRSKVNGNLSTTLCISLLDHRVFRIGIVFSLGTNHAKQIWSQSWLLSTDTIIIENSSDFSIQCVNVRPMWGKKKIEIVIL